MTAADFTTITEAIRVCGLTPRGGFHPTLEDEVPPVRATAARTVVLVGIAGRLAWPAFAASAEASDGAPHALDRWTRRVAVELADSLGAEPLFPFGGPPHHPFQRWAKRAEGLHASPLGLLIHPEYGLWNAYRAALAFADEIALPPQRAAPSPCAGCATQPCRTACPVSAIGNGPYDVPSCVGHITGAAGAACLTGGCLARHACPVGVAHRYEPAQQAFHMAAFAAAHANRPREA